MRYALKSKTWKDRWNDVIRTVFFRDEELKRLMNVPPGTPILTFITKYFIASAAPDELLLTEDVRIHHYDSQGAETDNQNVIRKDEEFDIFVKESQLHNVGEDRLQSRADLIAERIKYLLLKEQHICCMHFDYRDSFDLWTKTVGYQRLHLVFSYRISV